MSLLRSTLISVPLIALCTIVMDLLSMVVSFFDRSGNRPHHLARVWGKMLLAVSFVYQKDWLNLRGQGDRS